MAHKKLYFARSGMNAIAHYIAVRRETIFQYVVDRPIQAPCMEGEQRRGQAP